MRVHTRRLPATQRFLCSRRAIKELFGAELEWVSFGLIRSFRLDPRSRPRPQLEGLVVATLTVPPSKEAYLCLYPLPLVDDTEAAVEKFNASVLPQFREWLTAILSRPATEVFDHEGIIAEWVEGEYRLHQVRSKYSGT